jgi:hypothetical protein
MNKSGRIQRMSPATLFNRTTTQADINAYMGTDEYKMYAWQVLAIFAYLYHQPGMPIAH